MKSVKEQRIHHRMTMNTPIQINVNETTITGTCIDLSATGSLLHLTAPIEKGSHLSFFLVDATSPIPSMRISGKVIRCDMREKEEYEIALCVE